MASILNSMAAGDPQSSSGSNLRQSAFVLSNPPLAALHNMTEMKVPPNSATAILNSGSTYSQSSFKAPNMSNMMSLNNGTPHGINDILSRPAMANALGQLGLGPRFSVNAAAAAAAANVYFNNPAVRIPKLADLGQGRSHLYWPGVIPSPAWRNPGE